MPTDSDAADRRAGAESRLPNTTPWRAVSAAFTPGVAAAIVVATALFVGVIGVPGVASAQEELTTIDADHQLATNASIDEYRREGRAAHVSANLSTLDATLTVTEQHARADIPGYHTDFNNDYVCLEYREDIPRTLRVYIPADYFQPRPGQAESLTSSHTATFEPAADGQYTALTIHFDGAGRACVAFGGAAGWYFGGKDHLHEVVNNSTGWTLPSFAGDSAEWQYVPEGAFAGNTTYEIRTGGQAVTAQFDADAANGSASWLAVPDCDNPAEQRVCRYSPADNDTVVIMSTASNPPPVRYKFGHDPTGDLGSGLRDIRRALDQFLTDVRGLFGGGR